MKKKSLTINALLNTIKTMLGIIFPLITFPYITRVFDVDSIGIYNFSSSIISYFSLLAALGVSTYAIREGAIIRNDSIKMQHFVSEMFSINLLSTIISYLLLILLLVSFKNFFQPYILTILILSIQLFFVTIGVSWVCNIYEDFLFITIRTLIIYLFSLILIFVFVRDNNDLLMYTFISVIVSVVSNIINYFYVRKKYIKVKFVLRCNLKEHLKPILIIFSMAVTITVYVSSDTTIIGLLLDDYSVGLYSASVKVYTVIKNLLAAILMVLIPKFTILLNDQSQEKANDFFSKVFNILSIIMIPLVVGLYMESKNILYVISGEKYLQAAGSLRLLSIAVLFSLYAYLFIQCILIPKKMEKIVFVATLISAILNIIINFLLIPLIGLNAAALTTILAEAVTAILAYYYSRDHITLVNYKKNMSNVFWGCLVIILICEIFNRLIRSYIIALFLSMICSIFAYSMILIFLKNEILLSVYNSLKIRNNKLS